MKKLLSLLLCFSICSVCLSQTDDEMTPYELARFSLAKETLVSLLDNMSELDAVVMSSIISDDLKYCEDRYDMTAVCEEIIYLFCGLGELFKTDANYWYESTIIATKREADQIKTWSEIGKDYVSKREEIEKKKTDEDIEREKDRIKQKTGANSLFNKIDKAFSEWATKGEIEKTVQYNERMRTSSVAAFDSICYSCICKDLEENNRIRIEEYDADEEICKVIWEATGKNRQRVASKEGLFHVSPNDYLKLKNRLKQHNSIVAQELSSIVMVNGYIVPKKIRIWFGGDCDYFDTRLTRAKRLNLYDVVFSDEDDYSISSDIIKNAELKQNLNGHVFKCSDFVSSIVFVDDLEELIATIASKYRTTRTQEKVSYILKYVIPDIFDFKKEYFKKEEVESFSQQFEQYLKSL